MKPLRAWIAFSALILGVSLVVHLSTFFGINPMKAVPGVMFIHLLIFPPFGAAIYYANRVIKRFGGNQEQILKRAPRWMQWVSGILFAYAFINFGIFVALKGGGSPTQRDGKYFLTEHGRVIREISAPEYARHQAYVVRGFSGHWMLFSSAAMTMLAGARRRAE
jgi:hypothetical protein